MFLYELFLFVLGIVGAESFVPHLTSPTVETPRSALAAVAPQLLEFQEPRTNVTVILVGAMHYNPASIALAANTVETLGQSNALGAVIVEQCDIRWNKTAELLAQRPYLEPFYRAALSNEMRQACDAALSYNCPVILGDQRVNLTFASIQQTAKQTVQDLLTPIVGWKRLYDDVRTNFDLAVPLGEGYLNAVSLLDTRLLLAAPVSFVKYPLSFLVRNPITTSIAFSLLLGIDALDQSATLDSLVGGEASAADITLSFAFAALETIFVARIFLKPMLAERNVILAQNILEQCKIYQSTPAVKQQSKPWWWPATATVAAPIATQQEGESSVLDKIVYAPETLAAGICPNDRPKDNTAKTVVAVLGMAHCNGIKKLLMEQRV